MMVFLERVAASLYNRYGSSMENQVVVLPSRRAGLWLTRALAAMSRRPQWAPEMMTVTDLFRSLTTMIAADTESQIFTLYRVYRERFGDSMAFDDFWSWGEVIINDFNDIDLYMADAGRLYTNISDLREIDERFGGLTEEQVEIIRGFWSSFNPGAAGSEARSRFKEVWDRMGALYTAYRNAMANEGMAGDGMMCRMVAEKAAAGKLLLPQEKRWHIAGLNALNNCEKRLFRFMRESGVAEFYWDDDHLFMEERDHKAALFVRENVRLFGNTLRSDQPERRSDRDGGSGNSGARADTGKKRWQIIDTPSDTAQAMLAAELLEKEVVPAGGDLTSTAVILADEKLLMPLIDLLPPTVGEINVTMGHPFRLTPLYSFLRQLMAMIRSARGSEDNLSFRSDEVMALLRHQYFRLLAGDDGHGVIRKVIEGNIVRLNAAMLTEELAASELFEVPAEGADIPGHLTRVMTMLEEATFKAEADDDDDEVSFSTDREYLRMAAAATMKVSNLMAGHALVLKRETCLRLLDRIYRRLTIPFSGEPLSGVQVMGVLETRALEFDNIVFLSLNEGVFPSFSFDNTFIPYNIRRAFGLPTVNEQESVFAYHFFRLLRKPARGWFIYNSSVQGLNTGEMSRYLARMIYTPSYEPERETVYISVGRSAVMPETIERDPSHQATLIKRYSSRHGEGSYLSPSAVNTWINCRMRFYYRYVCNMPEEERQEKEIDQRRFGNILHEAVRRMYEPIKGMSGAADGIGRKAREGAEIRRVITEAAMDEMGWNNETLFSGKGIIIVDVLERYLRQLLEYDSRISDLLLMALEEQVIGRAAVEVQGEKINIGIGGRVDRIDMTGGVVRVVDYKTGAPRQEKVDPQELFNETRERHNDALRQTLLYCTLIMPQYPDTMVLPAIYWIQQIGSGGFSPYAPGAGIEGTGAAREEWERFMGDYGRELNLTLDRIFSPQESFSMTPFRQRCNYCPYRILCRR